MPGQSEIRHPDKRRAGQDECVLRVATLGADPELRPVVHIWTSHDVSWLVSDNLPMIPGGLALP
ncbi:MAG: hypothetical protein CVT74_02150 [Alphaproteobacteria bacterium HGW-Alphaproteobacteria-13]|nr:MAG: hypothetical protein CVT74_02150 [Alphaproteobacteria bacterium HGW-Alphaproteobacteria-13]